MARNKIETHQHFFLKVYVDAVGLDMLAALSCRPVERRLRYKNIRFILSHAGRGLFPLIFRSEFRLAERI
jgi:hypothetical protein